ncbi:hypothetical protein GALMADRAFT_731329 [Galerina marginata CBS 339.88]|uniref:Uncharacterized protein n=1 Tax=Galerina marginata (strain CBS 339.88) TaxID=685588 RepID=A0A067SR04_GALM3|nr:hypothetical protein GALMADRAFT_731329 [Galerina marginata CBS 339.88]
MAVVLSTVGSRLEYVFNSQWRRTTRIRHHNSCWYRGYRSNSEAVPLGDEAFTPLHHFACPIHGSRSSHCFPPSESGPSAPFPSPYWLASNNYHRRFPVYGWRILCREWSVEGGQTLHLRASDLSLSSFILQLVMRLSVIQIKAYRRESPTPPLPSLLRVGKLRINIIRCSSVFGESGLVGDGGQTL